ncbi:MAG: type II toxin-antitoxin system Phd/YefM family antitoxin [Nitrospira sp. SB0675_bin_23]|nr:type II toxin-antitoxin system Phd/YefM family antitoxin [Nitrospira sp. SB0661_bin_20]MYH02156.1 type II toxin-antitoxin system Phd/YefM family antitoxin [Nitrospira sp. SB0675_bin_23]
MRDMSKKVSTIQLRKDLTALLAEVGENGSHVIIEKRGKSLAALISVDVLELIKQQRTTAADPQGALALAGAWGELKEREMDALLAGIQSERGGDACRAEGKA